MFYVRIENGRAVEVRSVEEMAATERRKHNLRFESRHDWKTWERVEDIAEELNAAMPARTFLAVDSGPNVSPRFDVIEAPVLGAEVSMSFNGDSYPVGTITKISASFRRVETSDGKVFFRRRRTAMWSEGTFVLIPGVHNDRNPSF